MSNQPQGTIKQLTQSELFQKVSDICATVNAVTDAKKLLEISLKKTLGLFGAYRGSIFILNECGQGLTLKIAEGMALKEEERIIKKMGEGVVGRVAVSKQPIFVEDISQDDRFRNYKARKSYNSPSFICSPLLIKDKLIGVINIANKGDGNRFSSDELQLLDFLSSQIALNYRRIELYNKFKTVVRESQSLKDKLGKSSQETTHLRRQIVLQERLASLGKLAGGIAHEFNNPLDGVMRYTNLCLEHTGAEDVTRGYLLEIKQGLNRMANIVRSLLACSRNSEPTMKVTNPNYAIEQVVQSVQTDLIQREIQIKKEVAEGLPNLTDFGFERIVSNLVRNAIDAVESHGWVGIRAFLEDEKIVLEVKDSGGGIRTEDYEKLFEPFYTTKDMSKGCGLGLTIVSEIVKSYNGQINVESEVGKGTTFIVSIPINDE